MNWFEKYIFLGEKAQLDISLRNLFFPVIIEAPAVETVHVAICGG